MLKANWGWQGNAKTLRDRGEYLLKHLPLPADVTFEFENDGFMENIPAHKFMLAIGSEVFYAMFFGPAANTTRTTVAIPNYPKQIFEALIAFLYADQKPNFAGGKKAEIATVFLQLLQCATQYGVPELAKHCRAEILNSLRLRGQMNVCSLLAQARLLEEEEIECGALDEIDRHPLAVLKKQDLTDVSVNMMVEILRRSELNIKDTQEIELYKIAQKWAENGPSPLRNDEEAVKAKKARVKPDLVAALQPLMPHIRFALMTMDQLVDGPIKDGVMTQQEAAKLVKEKSVAVSRRSKKKQEVGCLNWRLSEEACEDYGDDDEDAREAMTLEILPDMKSCPETSHRFLDLCRIGYPFEIKYRSQELAKESQFRNFKQTEKRLPPLLLPLSSIERKLVHDLAGSVSLLWAPSESEVDKGDIKERKKGNTKRQKNKEFSGKWVLEIHAEGSRIEDVKGILFGRVLNAEGEDKLKKLDKTLEKKEWFEFAGGPDFDPDIHAPGEYDWSDMDVASSVNQRGPYEYIK